MARQYQITAEIKKGDQKWASVLSNRDSKMTEQSLAKMYGAPKIAVRVRNFQCARVEHE